MITQMLLDSWDRQCQIIDAVASLATEENRHFKPSEDGWSIDRHLAHCHNVRTFWTTQVAPKSVELERFGVDDAGEITATLETVRSALSQSAALVREVVADGLATGEPLVGENVTYDNPVLLLQHMIWHEGWHTGLIFLALRLNGQEPPEEWEEPNVWGKWRTENWE
jgi:uncharacterized damage-inducible protein DinB